MAGAHPIRHHMLERDLHKAVVQFLRWNLPDKAIVQHAMNEGKRGWRYQQMLKTHGVQAGWPDLEILHDGKLVLIELKAPKKHPTSIQKAMHERLRDAGFAVHVCRSIEEVQTVLELEGFPLKAKAA